MNYLQQERNYNILNGIGRILQQNGLHRAENLSLLADKTINRTGWTSVIMDAFDARAIPVYNSELITRINTAHHQEINQIHSTRKKLIEHIEKEINYRKKQISDACNEMRRKYTDVIRSHNDHQVAIANHLAVTEIEKLLSQKQSLAKSYDTEFDIYKDRHRQLQNELNSLQKQLTPIVLLSAASNQRHFA